MERNGVGMISQNYSAQDFNNLNLTINSDDVIWNRAIEMFTERFEERYFRPINVLSRDIEPNGFAIMSINCLLVDAFYQFEYGDLSTTNNTQHYTTFLKRQLSSIIVDDRMARLFYKNIRCGILHSAQTYGGCMLSTECHQAIEFFGGRAYIKVNVGLFSNEMRQYFDSYVRRLRSGDETTRLNFITKMNYVCS